MLTSGAITWLVLGKKKKKLYLYLDSSLGKKTMNTHWVFIMALDNGSQSASLLSSLWQAAGDTPAPASAPCLAVQDAAALPHSFLWLCGRSSWLCSGLDAVGLAQSWLAQQQQDG